MRNLCAFKICKEVFLLKIKSKILLKVIAFFAIFAIIFSALGSFFQPIWLSWNNFYTTKGFYKEPKDSIETVFLGASTVVNSISPTELYRDYGMCAYNLATEQQPILASHYWLEEAYRLHSKTLKYAVLDVSLLRAATKESLYHKAIDNMQFSSVKVRAIFDHKEGIKSTLFYFSPFITYHERWKSINKTDFTKYTKDPVNGTRGYNYEDLVYAEEMGLYSTKSKNPILSSEVSKIDFFPKSLVYFEKLVKFCKEKSITLIPIKIPASNWNSALHNQTVELLNKYDLDFIDLNFDPIYSELGYIHAYDTKEGGHLNYYGAKKVTNWLGKYLTENYDITDVRDDKKYDYLKDHLKEYNNRVIKKVELKASDNIASYLKTAATKNNTVFITINNKAVKHLSLEYRYYFKNLGLNKLSNLKDNQNYIAVLSNGKVIKEYTNKNKEDLTYKSKVGDIKFSLTSGKNLSSCIINGKENSKNLSGINVTVYNNFINEVIDTSVFDTAKEAKRSIYNINTPNDALNKNYYGIIKYNERINAIRSGQNLRNKIGNKNITKYIKANLNKNNIIVITLKDESLKGLTKKARENLKSLGLTKLASKKEGNSYIAYIDGLKIKEIFSKKPLNVFKTNYVKAASGIYNEKGFSSCFINENEYSPNITGINIVVYNKAKNKVINSTTFDTNTLVVV